MKKTFLILLFLAFSLLAALVLVQKQQETRRQAAVLPVDILVYPQDKQVQTGERFSLILAMDTRQNKVTAVDFRLKFNPSLLRAVSLTPLTSQNDTTPQARHFLESTDNAIDTRIDNQDGTINFLGVSFLPETQSVIGVLNMARLEFEALSSHTVSLTVDPIYQQSATAYSLPVTPVPTSVPSSPPVPTATPLPINPGIIKLKLTLNGLRDPSPCVDLSTRIIVMSQIGTTKTFSSVTLTPIGPAANGFTAYQTTLTLADFPYLSRLSLFIKGPKHLQTKYGVNGQSAYYNLPGGEITVTADPSTTPLYDFTGYPLPAGDIINSTSPGSDGFINGLDFAYVKNKAIQRQTVDPGGQIDADFDGNCLVNSVDITNLMVSLKEHLDQVY